jgi:TolB-like protein/Flp pilus assembly protein TadD
VTTEKPGFLEELKRRHVWRVAIAYAVSGWVLVQIATQVFPFFDIPNWTVRLVVVLIVVGFPIALILAWIYEITPHGVRRTEAGESPQARAELHHRSVGRKLDTIIIAVLLVAMALVGWRLYAVLSHAGKADVARRNPATAAPRRTAALRPTAAATEATVPSNSVAVLPFANESGKPDERFFSDGLSDDLINALSQFGGLKVISRNSAFQFRDSKDSSTEIGRLLGVAHLLEGSVQRANNEVRITATLVNASDGSIVWSQRYDKPYKDLFALQDAITGAVADALKAKLLLAPGAVVQSDQPPSGSVAAFVAFQHGNAYVALNSESGFRRAIPAYEEAVRLDPNYAAAYAKLSMPWLVLGKSFMGGTQALEAFEHARAAVDTALRLDPSSANAHFARAQLLLNADMNWTGAENEARRALQLAPNNAAMQFNFANVSATMGRLQRATELTHRALDRDPLHADWYYWLGAYLTSLGRLDAARQALDTAISLQPNASVFHLQLAIVQIQRGDAEAALSAARQEPPGMWRDIAVAQALQIGKDPARADAALKALIDKQADIAAVQIAETYALRRDPDDMFKWLDRAWLQHDAGLVYLLYDPLILRYRADPRFAGFCRKIGLPVTTDAVAMQ